ncbi:MAG: antitoxin VbhA family protein [Acidobacteriaceae bacterium]
MATWPKTFIDSKPLTDVELAERRYAVQNTIGTLRIEGLEMPANELDILERYARGTIEVEQVRAEMAALPLKCH